MTMIKIGIDSESRNWLLLNRLADMGFNKKEAIGITKAIEEGKITFKQVEKEKREILNTVIFTIDDSFSFIKKRHKESFKNI